MFLQSLTRSIAKVSGKVPLRVVLVVPFIIQIVGAVGIVGYLSFRNGQQAVNDVASQVRREISDRIEQNLHTYLMTPHQVNQINATAINLGQLNLQDLPALERHFWHQLKIFDTLTFAGLGLESRDNLGAERSDDGSLTLRVSTAASGYDFRTYGTNELGERVKQLNNKPNFDPRTRPWYKAAVAAGKPTWSPIYPHTKGITSYLGASRPFYDPQGKLQGVLLTNINLSQIGKFLQSLKIGKTGQGFIIERDGMLVATSTGEQPFRIIPQKDFGAERVKAANSGNPLTKATAEYLRTHFNEKTDIQNSQQLEFSIGHQRHFLQVLPLKDDKGLDWLIAVVIPESDFMEQINANTRTTILLCLVALGVATCIGIATSQYIVQPILRLKDAATALSEGQFDQTVNLQRSDELGVLAKAFNSMASQLQESFKTLELKNAELQRLDKLKDEFLANTSHELRTPLNGIIGITESLMDGVAGNLPASAIQNLALVAASGRRLSNLVNDILDFSKLRHQNIELQLKPVGVREIVDVVLALSRPLVGSKNLQLVNGIHPELPLVLADENRLQQILHNLVGNAIKFTESGTVEVHAAVENNRMPPGTELTSLSAASSYLAITISDTGIGISEDKFERIFESFEQADGSTAREYGGTGLGLAVTQQLVALHGGTITVNSTVGVGSRFTFTLPISDAVQTGETLEKFPSSASLISRQSLILGTPFPVDTNESQMIAAVTGELAACNILIVDDEPVNLQVLSNHLSLQNYAITQATNGLEALAIIDTGFKPDLVVLDVMMPRMTGYEVTQKIREQYPATELPIVLLTAKNQITDLVEGLGMGANDYLTKPIAKEELIARIKTHINLCKFRAENLRMGAELEVTRQLQKMLLPTESELESIPGLDIAGFMEPAEEVGGDYYDVLNYEGNIRIGIGDVTGHGLESGVVMIMVQSAIRTLLANQETDPIKFLNTVNRTIYDNVQRMDSDKHLSLCLLDYQNGQLKLIGQHEKVLVVRSNGQLEEIDTAYLGFPVGLEEDIADFLEQTQIELNAGDGVVLYTDGITQAENNNRELYGLERLCQVIQANWSKSANEIKQAAIQDLRQYIGNHIIHDDITLVVLKQK